jgi:hypothetical protein
MPMRGAHEPKGPAQPVASEHEGLMANSPCCHTSSCDAAMAW